MSNPTNKYILIPEYVPLYALKRNYGPPHGPLNQPVLTSTSVIGELLKQSGKEKCTIYEVIKTGTTKTLNGHKDVFSDPVQLTLENYMLPYAEIAGADPTEPETPDEPDEVTPPETPVAEPPAAVEPTVVTTEPEKTEVPETTEETATPVADVAEDTQDVTEEPEAEDDEDEEVPATQDDPYAGMTKKERKAARRAEREAAAIAAAAADAETSDAVEE